MAVRTRTIYRKSVKRAVAAQDTIKKSSNGKLGKLITKGRWKGFKIFTLTLEERRTCPTTCPHWNDCYGNNMPFAHRFIHGATLEKRIEADLTRLQQKHPNGFALRLHVLGDFYSIEYVQLWDEWLRRFPALHIWGYTARHPGVDPIGDAIESVRTDPDIGARFRLRYSGGSKFGLTPSADPADWNGEGFICPEQTGKTDTCGSCGIACAMTEVTVRFLSH